MNVFQFGKHRAKTKGLKPSASEFSSPVSFILEPILTPTAGIDGGDDVPDLAVFRPDDHGLHPHDFSEVPLILSDEPDSFNSHSVINHSGDLVQQIALTDTVKQPSDLVTSHLPDVPDFTSPSPQFESGFFTVGDTGQVSIDFVFDGGAYQGQLAIFSLDGMDHFQLGSEDFIREAAHRALSHSDLGHVVIDDASDAARFSGSLSYEGDLNSGDYQGVKTFAMRQGDRVGFMLVPDGTVQQVWENPAIEGSHRPLFSMATANPHDGFQSGQIADVNGDGNTFVFEDLRVDGHSDRDYNDLIFQLKGATGHAANLDDVIDANHDWRSTDFGQAILSYALPEAVDPHFDAPQANQPFVGVIDTGFSAHSSDIDYSHITLGHDWVDGDDNPLLQPGEGNDHGTHILGIIGATQDNGIGIDGINDQSPLWVGRAVGSGHWADSLIEFVDASKESDHHNAVVNLSLDLTQINPDGSVTTRYEFTPAEHAALEYAHQNHVLIVTAAGNDGGTMSILGQASQEFDNIITVGAADGDHRADYSSYGNGLDLLATGGISEHPVLSTVGDGIGTMIGTSAATAEVTGAISQVWAANPDLSYRQIIEILKATATDLDTPGWDLETGAGLLNIMAAVGLAKITLPEDYESPALDVLETWSGEGLVTPSDRAAASQNDFRKSLAFVLRWEGGYVNDPADPGGATNKGITQGTYNAYRQDKGLPTQSVRFITQSEVEDIYFNRYWKASGSDQLSPGLAMVQFDTAVNMGVSRANQFLAQARQSAGTDETSLINRYLAIREAYYRGIVANNPSQGKFLNGWLNRLNTLRKEVASIPVTPVNPGSSPINTRRPYVVRSGDTLWAIAQREWGDGNRWREIQKADGSTFTDAEVRTLQVGQTVYLPVKYTPGTGVPVTPTPTTSPTPVSIGSLSRAPDLFRAAYERAGGTVRGWTPTGHAYRWGNGWTQEFRDSRGDRMLLMLEDGADKAYIMWGGNLVEYEFLGGAVGRDLDGRRVELGYPRSDENIFQKDGKYAVWQAFAGENGKARIHYMDGIGSVATWGAIGGLYTDMGGAGNDTGYVGSFLGMPTRREYFDGDTIWADFQGGRIASNRNTGKTEALRPGEQPSWRQSVNIYIKPGVSNLTFRRGQEWVTSSNYKFIFQQDGNLVLYSPQGKAIWATGTDNTSTDSFVVQADGNVVLYNGNKAVWATDTAGNPGAYFAIQGDGNLVVYSSVGKALSSTGTENGKIATFTASADWLKKFQPVVNPQILSKSEFVNNWRNWSEYTSRNPFPGKGANCTWYAHGRMMQLGYSEYALDSMLGNAGTWDNTAGRGAKVVSQPQVPCIAVWEANVGGAGSVGHVAVVERINSDGSILISESNWPTGNTYGTRTIYPGSKWPSKFITVPKA